MHTKLPHPFHILKHLGNDNYVVNNRKNGRNYICKSHITAPDTDLYESLLHKYMRHHPIINKYVNPLAIQLTDKPNNLTHSFYPVIPNGFPLKNLLTHISKLDSGEQMILKHIIVKNILHALSTLHKIQIIHGNITPANIVVLFHGKPLEVKFINFDHSCGKIHPAHNEYYYRQCNKTRKLLKLAGVFSNNHNNVPYIFAKEIHIMKLRDIRAAGLLCINLLLDQSLTNADNTTLWQTLLVKLHNAPPNNNDDGSARLLTIHKKYIVYITTHMLLYPFKKNNNPAKYVADKIITFEKYA
jgi:serine/threonine protein kinase